MLDPVLDTPKLGSRYCTGGYVWQVTDTRLGELFSGPCFPDAEPPVFDGQGAPEVFELALGRETAKVGDDVWVIGVGRVRRESPVQPFHVRDNPTVVERVTWSVERSPKRITMRSRESFGGFAARARAPRFARRTPSHLGDGVTEPRRARNSGALVRAPVLSVGGCRVFRTAARNDAARKIPGSS